MRQLPPAAKKVIFYRTFYINTVYMIPVYIAGGLMALFAKNLSLDIGAGLAILLIAVVISLGSSLGSWVWSRMLVNSKFSYEVMPNDFRVEVDTFIIPTIEKMPYEKITSVMVRQDRYDKMYGHYSVHIETKEKSNIRFNDMSKLSFNVAPQDILCGFTRSEAEALRDEILTAKQNYKVN